MAPSTPSSLALSPSGSCWGCIPPEIILEIVSCLDYDPETLRNLRRVDKRTYRIMRDYEHSVCKSFATGQLRLGILRSPDLLFPSSGGVAADMSYLALAAVFHRTAAVTELARTIKTSSPCCWLLTWRHIFEAGIRLLIRLHASRTYNSKANFIYDMPLHALVAVFVVLHYGCRAAQNVGIGIIRRENQPADDRDLGDLLLMFQDLCLQCGPDFLSYVVPSRVPPTEEPQLTVTVVGKFSTTTRMLRREWSPMAPWCHNLNVANCDSSLRKLRSGWKALDSLQSPDANGNPPRPSLISHFNRAISFALECRLGEIHCMAMDVATRKAMRKMTDADVTNLVCFSSTSG